MEFIAVEYSVMAIVATLVLLADIAGVATGVCILDTEAAVVMLISCTGTDTGRDREGRVFSGSVDKDGNRIGSVDTGSVAVAANCGIICRCYTWLW